MITAGLVCFLSSVENAFVLMADWPYMNKVGIFCSGVYSTESLVETYELVQVDPEATTRFYGTASSVSTVAHLISALAFSFWTYKTHTVR